VRRVVRRPLIHLTERVGSGSIGAVLDAWRKIKTHERIRILPSEASDNGVVVIDCADRGNRRILPAVIEDQLPAARPKRIEIRVGRVEHSRRLFNSRLQVLFQIERAIVPIGPAVHHL